MKKFFALAIVGIMAFQLTACSGGSSSSASSADSSSAGGSASKLSVAIDGQITVATEPGFAPYEYTKGDEIVGVDMDIAKAIADEAGLPLEIYSMDFDGALTSVSMNKVDFAAAGISITPEREEAMDFSHEYIDSKEVVVVGKDSPAVSVSGSALAGSDLDGKIVAVQQGNVADSWVSSGDECKPSEVKRYTKFAQAAEDLKNKKVDCIVMDEKPAEELVASNDTLKIMDGVLFEDKYAIAVRKGNEALLELINKTIDKLKEDGKIDEFMKNHTGANAPSAE